LPSATKAGERWRRPCLITTALQTAFKTVAMLLTPRPNNGASIAFGARNPA
jgi:hypothetical protein